MLREAIRTDNRVVTIAIWSVELAKDRNQKKKKTEYIAVYMITINGKNINRQKIEDWNMELYLGN